ncbi:hypothetical protein IV203_026525 [Nitzschia inconspicua]|uniref:Uncharacterized protein n=1 Tax=Nitzschia inconspicua TaxID=303405 RepID=A0A9K3LK43_9STRA|nr:hypothetical protein IV203_026525 [Nitzschia inconspicua]
MNSFREKFGLIVLDSYPNESIVSSTSTIDTTFLQNDAINMMIESNSQDFMTETVDGRKKRADTAETEASFPLQSTRSRTKEEDSRLENIGSYDEEECVIYHSDSSLSLSDDEIDSDLRSKTTLLPPLDTARVFAEADTVLGISNTTLIKGGHSGKTKKRNRRSNTLKGLFSSGRLLPVVRNKSDAFSQRVNINNNDDDRNQSTTTTTSAARSRKFFSLSKVPASIAEEPCSTPSSTSASVASST